MFIRPVSLVMTLLALSMSSNITAAEPLLSEQWELSPSEQLVAQNNPQNPQNPQNSSRGRRWRDGSGRGRIIEQLNLTTEQKQKMVDIRQKYQGQLKPLKEQISSAREELSQMMSGTATADEIRAKHQEILKLRQQLGDIRFESLLEMREVLTPEQRTQFAQLMEKRHQNFRQRQGDGVENEE
jgi:Spy/CpxP family protein refolding chaperone